MMSMTPLPRTMAALQTGMSQGLHIGAQFYASLDGAPVADLAIGKARTDALMTTQTLMRWASGTKPFAAVALAQLWEAGLIDLYQPVGTYIPEFACKGKEYITLFHILTHTAGLRNRPDRFFSPKSWEEELAYVCEQGLRDSSWRPGERVTYNATAWIILGEVVQRISGVRFDQYVRRKIFLPLGMTDCWIGMPTNYVASYGQLVSHAFLVSNGRLRLVGRVNSAEMIARCMPAASGVGPMNQLSKFYDSILKALNSIPNQIVRPATARFLTESHVVDAYDECFERRVSYGAGFATDWRDYGPYCPPGTFGHRGMDWLTAFADPRHCLVACIATSGQPDATDSRRFHAITAALYEDLGLANADR